MKKPLFLIVLILLFTTAFAQEYFSLLEKKKVIKITENSNNYELGFQNIIANSEIVIVQNDTIKKNIDYEIFYKEGKIRILKLYPTGTEIIVMFKVFPKDLKYSYLKFKKPTGSGGKDYKPIRVMPKRSEYSSSSKLNISGSKSFAITVGNQEDLDLDQSLFLQIDGELSDKIFIKAQLSDNNSPIAPEGTTKKISELDKMLIKIYSGNYALSFGDFFCKFDDTHFANYDYKLEGVNFHWDARNQFDASAAVSNGEFISYKFYGTEGKQGPYYLPGKNISSVKVLAGTEKIYLNGKLLTRGEDYTIDYNEGSLTFKNKNVIIESSYIIADYEYSAEGFRSNLYLTSGNFSLFDNNANLFFKILSDSNDRDKPLNYTFSHSDKDILSQAGDDPTKACKNGVDSVAVGEGNYILITDSSAYYYQYNDSLGNYLVSFTYVGDGNGSYQKSGYYQFEWVGEGNGDYEPIIQLPMPEKNLNFDFGTKIKLGKLSIYSEGIISDYDKNSFSDLDDNDNKGFALYNECKFESEISKLGKASSSVFYKYKNRNFHPLTRIESAETEYKNSEFTATDTVTNIQYGGDIGLEIKNWARNQTTFSIKNLKNIAKQHNLFNNFSYSQNENVPFIPSVNYNFSQIKEKSAFSSPNKTDISQTIHNLKGNYKYKFFSGIAGYYKRQTEFTDTIFSAMMDRNFYETVFDFVGTKISARYERENNYQFHTEWQKSKKADLWQGKLYFGKGSFNVRSEYSHRENIYFTEESNSKFDLLDSQISTNFLNKSVYNKINYKIGNLQSYPKVRELVYVGNGNGIYDSLGFYQEDGDYDYKITRVGEPEPVTELQLNWNLNLNPARFVPNPQLSPIKSGREGFGNEKKIDSQFRKMLNKFLFTSDIAIQEKSKTTRKLDFYLLKHNALMNENTDYGYQKYREQLWYNIRTNKIVTKLLYEKTKKMDNQYENVFDRLWQDEWEFAFNFYNVNKWNFENEVLYKKRKSNYKTAEFLNSKNYIISTDIGYKFNYNLLFSTELAYDLENGKKEDGTEPYKIYSYRIEPRITYNAGNKYHLLAQVHFQENKRKGSDYLSDILISKRNGIITRATLQFDYKFSKYVTGFLKYFAEKYPEADVKHQLKMEVRADF